MASKENDWFELLISEDRKKKRSEKTIKEIKELMYLFVDCCPSQKGTFNSKKLADYGLIHDYDYTKYKEKLFKNISLQKENYNCFKSSKEFSDSNKKITNLYHSRKKPLIYFLKGEYGEIDTLFTKLRNAFAHGNYFKKGDYYVIWNLSQRNNQINAFMLLKYSHLSTIFETLNDFSGSTK